MSIFSVQDLYNQATIHNNELIRKEQEYIFLFFISLYYHIHFCVFEAETKKKNKEKFFDFRVQDFFLQDPKCNRFRIRISIFPVKNPGFKRTLILQQKCNLFFLNFFFVGRTRMQANMFHSTFRNSNSSKFFYFLTLIYILTKFLMDQ